MLTYSKFIILFICVATIVVVEGSMVNHRTSDKCHEESSLEHRETAHKISCIMDSDMYTPKIVSGKLCLVDRYKICRGVTFIDSAPGTITHLASSPWSSNIARDEAGRYYLTCRQYGYAFAEEKPVGFVGTYMAVSKRDGKTLSHGVKCNAHMQVIKHHGFDLSKSANGYYFTHSFNPSLRGPDCLVLICVENLKITCASILYDKSGDGYEKAFMEISTEYITSLVYSEIGAPPDNSGKLDQSWLSGDNDLHLRNVLQL